MIRPAPFSKRMLPILLLGFGLSACMRNSTVPAQSQDVPSTADASSNTAAADQADVARATEATSAEPVEKPEGMDQDEVLAQCQMLEAPESAECEARVRDGFEHKTDIENPGE